MGARGGADSAVKGGARSQTVVWMPRATQTPAEASLLTSLNRGGVEPVVVTKDLWAMAHACVMGPGTLLVLCDPLRLSGAAQVVLALRKYAPGVVVYAFEPGTPKLLRPVVDQDLVDWGAPGKPAEPVRAAPERAAGKPYLRLTDGADGGARPIGPSLPITEHNASASDVLSADELAMLLGRNGSKNHDGGAGSGNAKGDQR